MTADDAISVANAPSRSQMKPIAGKAEVNATSTVTVEKRSQNYVVTYLPT